MCIRSCKCIPFRFVQLLLRIFHRLFLVLVPVVFYSLYSKAIALRSYHFVVCRVESKNGDAIGGGGDESDEALA